MRYFWRGRRRGGDDYLYICYFFHFPFYMGIAVATAQSSAITSVLKTTEKIRETTRYSFITIAVSSVLIMAVSAVRKTDYPSICEGWQRIYHHAGRFKLQFSPVFLFIGWNVFLSALFYGSRNGLIPALIFPLCVP